MTQSSLPAINRFIAGWITNRNPIFTPFSIVGLNMIQHHDALTDGLNTELSVTNTLIRRPGFTSFLNFSATPRDFFSYKDLTGAISLFFDVGGDLYQGTTQVSGSVNGSTLWSVAPAGNFLYAVNGKTALRIDHDALTSGVPMGIASPTVPPRLSVNTSNTPYFTSSFIPTDDEINGLLVCVDGNNNRQVAILIETGVVHFSVQYTGNVIAEDNKYTQVTSQTQTGTDPNTTTTDVVTSTSGYTGTATGTGITNGQVAYYPSQGLSTLDFDYAFSGTMTLSQLVNIINAVDVTFSAPNIPASATSLLRVFVKALLLTGKVASTLYPDTDAQAIQLTTNGK